MKRLLPCLLLPALALTLTACISFGDDAPEPGGVEDRAAAAGAAAIPVGEVTRFEGLIYDGSVLGVWEVESLPQWRVRNVDSGEAVTVQETRRTDCCIFFQERSGPPMVADFQAMEVQFGSSTLSIGDVLY
ncbi:MAG: hypothetical protein ACFCVH_02290 [Alphaproteobacteria bacterium]